MKFLHMADTHLGAKLSGFNTEGIKFVKTKIEKALINLEIMLESPKYDGLILSGDIFDSPKISPYYKKNVERLFKIILDRGGFVVYATGNHDYFISENDFDNLLNYDRFILFTEDRVLRKEIDFKNKKVAFYGIGYQEQNPGENISGEFPDKGDEDIAIAVLHGEVYPVSVDEKSLYYSASAHVLAQKGYDYMALGHTHNFKDFGFNLLYSGCPYPQGMDETGEKAIVSVSLNEGMCTYERERLVNYRIYDLEFHAEAENKEELAVKLKDFIKEEVEIPLEDALIRVKGKVSGFDDYIPNEDLEFKENIFDYTSAGRNIVDLSYEKSQKVEEFHLPKDLEEAIDLAIEELKDNKESAYTISKLECGLSISELIEETNLKEEIIEMMRKDYENK